MISPFMIEDKSLAEQDFISRRMFMLGRHQRVTAKERTLVTHEFKQAHSFHTHEKRRLKRAMNKRLRQALKQDML